MDNGKQVVLKTNRSNTLKNLSSNANAVNAAKNEPGLTIQRAAFTPKLLSPGDLPVLQQFVGNRIMQRMLAANDVHDAGIAKPEENRTGMPDWLKDGLECFSGLDLAKVRVHYNSDRPVKFGALAYTMGTHIYVAPGQERHLPHEGWHVVQQMQGRVSPTFQLKGVGISDDQTLEREAEEMGRQAELSAQLVPKVKSFDPAINSNRHPSLTASSGAVQRMTIKIEGRDDQDDFQGTEESIATYLGETPVAMDTVDLIVTDDLKLWGHMTSERMGNLTFEQLAAQLIAKGYRGCEQIRLIGCNDPSNPIEAPKRLWNALYQQLSQIILQGHQPEVPPIYATKGKLHTGSKGLPPEMHWYVVENLLPEEKAIEQEYNKKYGVEWLKYHTKKTKYRREAGDFVEKLLEKFAPKSQGLANKAVAELVKEAARELAAESRGEYNEETAIKLAQGLGREFAEEFIKSTEPIDKTRMVKSIYSKWIRESRLKKNFKSRIRRANDEKKKQIRELYDRKQVATAEYSSIFRLNQQMQWEWNPDAWVCYDGKTNS